jgi:sugar O-acyltransferase (sialic acid O-acetyltransferase NeuD family)
MKSREQNQSEYILYIYGAGGHGKVVLEAAISDKCSIKGFLDDDNDKWNRKIVGYPVYGGVSFSDTLDKNKVRIVVAIGNNLIRKSKVIELSKKDLSYQSVIHRKTLVSPYSSLGEGSMIIAGAIINIDTHIGDHVIINTGATVDHDCLIQDFVHIAPGVHMGGEVQVGEGTLVGIGSVVKPGVKIGAWSVIGAGAVVTSDIPDQVVVVGVPARIVREIK